MALLWPNRKKKYSTSDTGRSLLWTLKASHIIQWMVPSPLGHLVTRAVLVPVYKRPELTFDHDVSWWHKRLLVSCHSHNLSSHYLECLLCVCQQQVNCCTCILLCFIGSDCRHVWCQKDFSFCLPLAVRHSEDFWVFFRYMRTTILFWSTTCPSAMWKSKWRLLQSTQQWKCVFTLQKLKSYKYIHIQNFRRFSSICYIHRATAYISLSKSVELNRATFRFQEPSCYPKMSKCLQKQTPCGQGPFRSQTLFNVRTFCCTTCSFQVTS